jgi:DNA repair and recombination protein RAD54B
MHKVEVGKLGIDVVMCDEAHHLKNTDAQITQAVSGLATRRRLLISGAPACVCWISRVLVAQ